jgi:pimeloyl-ACP methyl ester carboxylesterase
VFRAIVKVGVALVILFTAWFTYSFIRLAFVENLGPKTAPVELSIQWVKAHDVDVAFQHFKTATRPLSKAAPSIVLVHGTGAWSGTWVSNVAAITQSGFDVYALDLPPFGFSTRPASDDYSRATQAKRIVAFVNALNLDRPVILGHSFGGGPTVEAVMVAPASFRHLILVDAAMGNIGDQPADCERFEPAGPFKETLAYAGVAALGTQPFMSGTLLKQFVTRKEVVTPERTAIYQVPFQKRGFSANLAKWGLAFGFGCETPLSAVVANYDAVKVPTSIIWGEQDTVTPLAQAQRLSRLIQNANLQPLADVGHIPQIEDVNAFNQALTKVLASIPR